MRISRTCQSERTLLLLLGNIKGSFLPMKRRVTASSNSIWIFSLYRLCTSCDCHTRTRHFFWLPLHTGRTKSNVNFQCHQLKMFCYIQKKALAIKNNVFCSYLIYSIGFHVGSPCSLFIWLHIFPYSSSHSSSSISQAGRQTCSAARLPVYPSK
jgi:hypothetical protein